MRAGPVAGVLLLACTAATAAPPVAPQLAARAWVLADLSSGQVLAAERAGERFAIASLTKLMSAYVVFGALRDKRLEPAAQVQVSQRAWRAGGSRMFIEPGRAVSVEELIRGVVVQSGNDAALALAESLAGSEDAFVALMNREAERLGMRQTSFANATGAPAPGHASTAGDLALLAGALIRDFPADYARYYAQKEFSYNGITQQNRNRLLWLDPSVDGVKTGHTEEAGYCLIASSARGGRRLISVLLGASTEGARARESQKLLNWGYQNFDGVKLYAPGEAVKSIAVWKGAAALVPAGFAQGLVVTVPKGEAALLKAELATLPPVLAPVAKGQRVGTLRVALGGAPLGEYPVTALAAVPAAGFFGRAWDTLRLWFE
ncbi:MAG TPA: D-alanyl-D-alanine carboxypeptidase family protein [Burkholderiales bacterium]|nr:D-alanyl-D-alanine carboxypeptidase family protein [Burkholderiales bacterium]